MIALEVVMWTALALIVWTHVAYPLVAGLGARVRRFRAAADDAYLPSVTLVIVAHDEAGVIGERLDNALALDYPGLDVVVASDGSTDGTNELVVGRGVRLVAVERLGKTGAQDAAVRTSEAEIVAFSDANSAWEPGALRLLVRNLADPKVGYVCGRLRLAGVSEEGLYWRYELWLRAQESGLGSITAGNGAIYAVRRSAYPELGSRYSHDIGLPYRLRRRGLRAVYEPAAVAVEPAAASTSAEWGRKVRMLSRSWYDTVRGGMLDPRGLGPVYYAELHLAPAAALRERAASRGAARDERRPRSDLDRRRRAARRPACLAGARRGRLALPGPSCRSPGSPGTTSS